MKNINFVVLEFIAVSNTALRQWHSESFFYYKTLGTFLPYWQAENHVSM